MGNFLLNRLRGAGKTITEIREEPGKSNAGKYPNVSITTTSLSISIL